jgi:SAM-dependent methyltransferase
MAHDHHHHHAGDEDWEASAELLELEADLLRPYLLDATDWVRQLAANRPRRRIVDLGSGPGVGTLALAQCFPDADVVAVDLSPGLLGRIQTKALDLGVAGRVSTVQADLDLPFPAVGAVDVAWASMSLHHLEDPVRVLRDLLAVMSPGGLVAVAEMGQPLRLLPDDVGVGHPGLEDRVYAAVSDLLAASLPYLNSDWGVHLAEAGFAVVAQRTFTVDLLPPLPATAGRFARLWLQRMRDRVDGGLTVDDVATLDTLIDSDGPDGVLNRDDLVVRTSRELWVAAAPVAST